jgi:hypothetical protein
MVTVSVSNLKKTFNAKVSSALPQFDANTRTLKVRLEADNPGYILRPDMFLDIELPINMPPAITVPADAILDSGLKKTVFVDKGNGVFELVRLKQGGASETGSRSRRARARRKIAMSGTFLIDSESRMELAAQGMYGTMEGIEEQLAQEQHLARVQKNAFEWSLDYIQNDHNPVRQKIENAVNQGQFFTDFLPKLRDHQIKALQDMGLKVLETPGHTPEHICYAVMDHSRGEDPVALFSGDTLFVGDVGRPDLFPGQATELAGKLFESLGKLKALPDHVLVLPAHGAGSLCGRGVRLRVCPWGQSSGLQLSARSACLWKKKRNRHETGYR